jgi:hypothetical protein
MRWAGILVWAARREVIPADPNLGGDPKCLADLAKFPAVGK